jgi:hypothetical protein
MAIDDDLIALAQIQATVVEARKLAAQTKTPGKRDICLQIAGAIERQARQLDAEALVGEPTALSATSIPPVEPASGN